MTTYDVKQAVDALGRTFAEFRAANDEALRQKADRGTSDPTTEHKIERINDDLDTLRDRTLSITGNAHVLTNFQSAETRRDADGLTYHGVVKYRVLVQAN
jgi:hypothetical protein